MCAPARVRARVCGVCVCVVFVCGVCVVCVCVCVHVCVAYSIGGELKNRGRGGVS